MTPTEALATLFAALWLVTSGLYIFKAVGYDDALADLRGLQEAHNDMAADLAESRAEVERITAERDSCLALANEYAPVPFELVDISEDVADLHAAAYFEDLGWQA